MSRRDSLLAALVACIWGFNFVVIDWGMAPRDGHHVPALLFAAIRFALVAFPALLFVPRPRAPWRTILLVGTFMSMGQFGFLYAAMHAGMPPGLAALVLQSQVVFTIVIAAGALGERVSTAQVLGISLGVVGLVTVALGRGGHVPLGALLLCVAAGLSWGIGNVIARAARVPGGLGLVVWSALIVPVPLLGLSLLLDGPSAVGQGIVHLGWRGGVSTVYTVVMSTLVAYGIFNTLLARHPSHRVVPWILLVPPVAIASAWTLQGEVPNAAELAGAALLILGVMIAQGVLRLRVRPAALGVRRPAPVRPR